MTSLVRAVALLGIGCAVAVCGNQDVLHAQAKLSFDVASIKRNVNPSGGGGFRNLPGGRFTAMNASVSQLLSGAFPDFRAASTDIVGPEWIFYERYDVLASAGREVSREEMSAMMRTLLEERFNLRAHVERQEQATWDLVVARTDGVLGPDLKPFTHVCGQSGRPPCGVSASREAIRGVGVPISRLAGFFTGSAEGRRIFDKTGLTGLYEFKLVYRPADSPLPQQGDDRPNLFTALQEQLGLKLVSGRGVVDMLIVDHIERPTEN